MTSEFVVHRPGGPLRGLVADAVGYRQDGLEPGVHRGLPSPALTLIVTLDDPLEIAAVDAGFGQHVDVGDVGPHHGPSGSARHSWAVGPGGGPVDPRTVNASGAHPGSAYHALGLVADDAGHASPSPVLDVLLRLASVWM